MVEVPTLVTPRLLLRQWREADLSPYAALNADPAVMRYFPQPFTPGQSADQVARFTADLAAGRPGLYAAERRDRHAFIGFVGLNVPTFEARFMPCVEIGWRLAPDAWGEGFASEGAQACLAHGFEVLGLAEIVSFTSIANRPSRAVMDRIGMTQDRAGTFDHPRLPDGHELQAHVLYRLDVETWRGQHRDAVS